jgi:lipopolysaccharide/colanic/teichoic acid biosynthesis glycosyltransferase
MYLQDGKSNPKITLEGDKRITPSGLFLRKYKIDELPQLIDVMMGKMSIVGPRPEVPEYVEKYPDELRKKIFKMRPGITDWASIKFKDENIILGKSQDPEKTYIENILPIKLEFYEAYFYSASIVEDLKIIIHTLFRVFGRATKYD